MKEISIQQLIKNLEELAKQGCTKVEVKGTLMCVENGNTIIISSEKQM